MQLDQARIAIAERTWPENLDLALQVARRWIGAIANCTLLVIVPLAVLNHVLLVWIGPSEFRDEDRLAYYYLMVLLVMIEAPLATAPITLYLGQALFVERPSPLAIGRELLASLPQMLLLQVVLRTILIVPVITLFVPFGHWPFLNEVILLERNPLTARGGRLSTLKRNAQLHRANGGEFIGRALLSGGLAALLVFALVGTALILWSVLWGGAAGPMLETLGVQAALWIVAIYFTLARFLSYLDQRIRGEGWEVELLLRAQRERLSA